MYSCSITQRVSQGSSKQQIQGSSSASNKKRQLI
uniref:Uncharacterized protein n=1 Tax=Arundo donax TaxID=35708 RepID=A0A0A9CAN6_ARUDO